MTVDLWPIDRLVPVRWNSRKISDAAIDKEFGCVYQGVRLQAADRGRC